MIAYSDWRRSENAGGGINDDGVHLCSLSRGPGGLGFKTDSSIHIHTPLPMRHGHTAHMTGRSGEAAGGKGSEHENENERDYHTQGGSHG